MVKHSLRSDYQEHFRSLNDYYGDYQHPPQLRVLGDAVALYLGGKLAYFHFVT